MSFQVSDKVVCVDDSNIEPEQGMVPVKKGVVYVVEGIEIIDGEPGLHLVGHPAGYTPILKIEHAWRASRFRKLSDIQEENRAKAYYGASLDAARRALRNAGVPEEFIK